MMQEYEPLLLPVFQAVTRWGQYPVLNCMASDIFGEMVLFVGKTHALNPKP